MASRLLGTVIILMTRVLGAVFGGDSWAKWRAILKAAFALPLTDDELAIVRELTHRLTLPTKPVRELWLFIGRRAGKTIIAALLAVFATCCCTYTLAPGEVGIFIVIAADRRQARVIKRYVSGLLRAHPSLEALIERETAEAIWLTNGLCIEIHTCSYRSLRGYTCIGAAVDEVAFWNTEDSANPDKEVLVALRAAMASVPEAMLVGLSSVYARRGEVWRIFEKYFGKDTPDILVVNAPTRSMNPTISETVINAAYEDDPIAAAAEYGAEFRRDVEDFMPFGAVEAVRMVGRYELPYNPANQASGKGFADPAGGSGTDSMTGSVAHTENGRVILDAVWEIRPPFSPEAAVKELAANFKRYGITEIESDRYAGTWPTEAFRKEGITVKPSERTRSEIYLALLPMVMSGQVELLDHPRLLKQLASLERRKGRQGKDSVDAPPRQHEDVANAAAGALVLAGLNQGRGITVRKTLWG